MIPTSDAPALPTGSGARDSSRRTVTSAPRPGAVPRLARLPHPGGLKSALQRFVAPSSPLETAGLRLRGLPLSPHKPRSIMPQAASHTTSPSLLDRLKSQPPSQEAWSQFDARYRLMVMRFALAQGLQHSDAEDIAQQTMADLARAMPGFRYQPERCRFRTFLFRIAACRIVDWRRRYTPPQAMPKPTDEPLTDPEMAQRWEEEWERFVVESALDRLSECRRLEPHVARVLHELYARRRSAEEVSRALGLKPNDAYRVRSRWHDALLAAVTDVRRDLGE